ncbi:hypothetical protein [Shewanella sp. OMA3-2]|uniref:hypothetical protein n=1 Tax=Shewanella sp. OMA3-2 TaxID=2908650 RepID=UPI001F474586|nr:hypothetical protein [Shewanella sp. OMA3-2]UJF22878.1 hypothetical protein L0B17_05705 [Shewanella sp. OMA3-2]
MLNIPSKFDDLFAAYLGLRLSAFDNAKLVVAVLAAHQYQFQAAEIKLINKDEVQSTPRYAIKWLGLTDNQVDVVDVNTDILDDSKSDIFDINGIESYCRETRYCWIDCGKINQYEVGLSLIDPQGCNIQVINTITVPVMTMQQVGFMCVESAHFDHC